MAGTREGGIMASITNKSTHGDDFYKKIGAMGGKAKVPKGFAKMDRVRLQLVSSKGGSAKRREY